jgi:predicted phage tail component-like protein
MTDVSIDGTNLSTYDFLVASVVKPLSPKQKQELAKTQSPRAIQLSKNFDTGYTLKLKGVLDGSSPSGLVTKIENLAGFLYSDTDRVIIPSDQSDRYWNGQYLDDVEVEREEDHALLELSFTCNDPLAYAVTPDTDSQTITVLNSTFNLTNSGHYYAYPTITVTFNQDQSHFYIENQTIEDCRFDFSESFVSGDILIINSKTGVITLNGTAFYSGFGSGGDGAFQFIKLAFGASAANLICVGSDDATIDIDVDSSWEKTYLS